MVPIQVIASIFLLALFFISIPVVFPFFSEKKKIKNPTFVDILKKTKRLLLLLLFIGSLTLMIGQIIFIDWRGTDFCQEFVAIHQLIQHKPVYVPLHCWPGYNPIPQDYNSHPPFSVLFFLPFIFFTRIQATIIWGFLCLGCYLLAGILLLKEVKLLSFRNITFFLFFSILWVPFLRSEQVLNYGQLFFLFLVLAWIFERRKQFNRAGIVIGIITLLKIWPVVFLFLALIKKQTKTAVSGFITIFLGSIMTLLIAGKEIYIDYFKIAQPNEYHWIFHIGNYSLVGFIARFLLRYVFSFHTSTIISEFIGLFCLAGVFGFIWYMLYLRKTAITMTLATSTLLTAVLFTFPVTWEWGFIFLLLSLAMFYDTFSKEKYVKLPVWWKYVTVGSLLIFLEPNIILDLLKRVKVYTVTDFLLLSFPTYMLLVFTIMQMYLLWWYTNKAKKS